MLKIEIFIVPVIAIFAIHPVYAVRGCTVIAVQPELRWKKAICDSSSSKLIRLPADLPEVLINLRVMQQSITRLTDEVLQRLVYLEALYLESSELEQVDVHAFRGLSRLRILSFRNNSLRLHEGSLLSATFLHLPKLEVLDLSENPLGIIPSNYFPAPVGRSLVELRLSHTKSDGPLNLDVSVFLFLERLQILDLSFAGLRTLSSDYRGVLTRMENLTELQLGGNPWLCDCALRWLKQWFLSESPPTLRYSYNQKTVHETHMTITPTCSEPHTMRGKQILGITGKEVMRLEDFQCQQWIAAKQKTISVIENKNVSLICHGFAETNVGVHWLKERHVINKLPIRYNTFRSSGAHFQAFLNITNVLPEDAGVWECGIGDIANLQKASINLTVKRSDGSIIGLNEASTNSVEHRQNLIYTGVGIAALFILLAAIGLSIFCCWGGHGTGKSASVQICAAKFGRGNAYQCGIPSIGNSARELIGNRAANSRSDSPGPVRPRSPSSNIQHLIDANPDCVYLDQDDANISSIMPANSVLDSSLIPAVSTVLIATEIPQSLAEVNTSTVSNYADLFPIPAIPIPATYGTLRHSVPISNGILASLANNNGGNNNNNASSRDIPDTHEVDILPTALMTQNMKANSILSSPMPCPLHGSKPKTAPDTVVSQSISNDPCPIHGSHANVVSKYSSFKVPKHTISSFTQTLDRRSSSLQPSWCSKSTTSLCNTRSSSRTLCQPSTYVLPVPYARRDSFISVGSSSYKPNCIDWRSEGRVQSLYRTLPSKMRGYTACPIHGQLLSSVLKKRSASVVLERSSLRTSSSSGGNQRLRHQSIHRSPHSYASLSSSSSSACIDGDGEDIAEYTTDTTESHIDNSTDNSSSDYSEYGGGSYTQRIPLFKRYPSQNSVGSRGSRRRSNLSVTRVGIAAKRKNEDSSDSDSQMETSSQVYWNANKERNEDKETRPMSVFSENWEYCGDRSTSSLSRVDVHKLSHHNVFPKLPTSTATTIIGQPVLIAFGDSPTPSSMLHCGTAALPFSSTSDSLSNSHRHHSQLRPKPRGASLTHHRHSNSREFNTYSSSSSAFCQTQKSILVRPRSKSQNRQLLQEQQGPVQNANTQ